MAKPSKTTSKSAPAKKSAVPSKSAAPAKVAARTDVRNSPVPKSAVSAKPVAAAPAAKPLTRESIALRAYEIWSSGTGGSEFDNWVRAERELRGGL